MSSAISGCINDRDRLIVGSARACIWLQNELPKLVGRTPLAYAILQLNNNTAERFGRGIAIGRERYKCVRSDCGGQSPASINSLMEVDKLNCVDRAVFLTQILSRIADHKINRTSELLPWKY